MVDILAVIGSRPAPLPGRMAPAGL